MIDLEIEVAYYTLDKHPILSNVETKENKITGAYEELDEEDEDQEAEKDIKEDTKP